MYNENIIYYSKNHPNKKILDDYDITHAEDNRTCWDDLNVYLKIVDNKIKDWSFTGDTAIITTACASMYWESIVGMDLKDVLKLDYQYIEDLIEQPITDRRKQASVLALLSTRNAIHNYLKDWKQDSFDDVIN